MTDCPEEAHPPFATQAAFLSFLIEDACHEGIVQMLKKYPQQVWVQFPDSRLVTICCGAARHWLRNHEPSIPLNALLSSLEQGYPCHEELRVKMCCLLTSH